MRTPTESRTLARGGRALSPSRRRAARAAGPRCVLCDGVATLTDPADGRLWCARDFARLHAALTYRADVAAGLVPARSARGTRAVVVRGVPSAARRQAGAANRAAREGTC